MDLLKPMPAQTAFLNWEFGMFFHFGIRSFYPGHRDWDGIEMPASGFDPKELDCDEWMRVARDAGATYAILTAKHHDGFALWPSAYSRYSVAQSPWKNGKGDVVREFTDACRRNGMKVGLYYSPAQWGSTAIKFENGKEYDDYFINQLSELLTNYGKIDYLWFDGCGSEGHIYDKERIVAEIYRLQPDILTFCDPGWATGVLWVGNEDGYASLENPLLADKWDFSERSTKSVNLLRPAFVPRECDCKLRATWFYDQNEDTIKSLDELFGMYEMSVGHGSNFLLNVGPDNRGRIADADRARVHELGEKIRANYGSPISEFEAVKPDGENAFSIENPNFRVDYHRAPLAPIPLVNTVELSEDMTDGQKIRAFRIYAHMPFYKNKRILVFSGCTVGHKVLCRFGAIRAPKITVEITDADAGYILRDIRAFYVN